MSEGNFGPTYDLSKSSLTLDVQKWPTAHPKPIASSLENPVYQSEGNLHAPRPKQSQTQLESLLYDNYPAIIFAEDSDVWQGRDPEQISTLNGLNEAVIRGVKLPGPPARIFECTVVYNPPLCIPTGPPMALLTPAFLKLVNETSFLLSVAREFAMEGSKTHDGPWKTHAAGLSIWSTLSEHLLV